MALSLLPFRLVFGPVTTELVEVDGVDVTDQVAAVSVSARTGEPTKLWLEQRVEGGIEGEGIVHVVGEASDQQGAVLAWLSNIDPKVVSSEVLERMGPGSGDAPTETLAYLRMLAGG